MNTLINANILKFCFVLCILGILTSFAVLAAAPTITFIDPTPANNAQITGNNVSIKATATGNTVALDWNKSLVGWWRFNAEPGESSTLFKDWSTYGSNGTCSGTTCPTAVTGKFGKAVSFNGSNYLDLGTNASLKPAKDITIELWVNPAAS